MTIERELTDSQIQALKRLSDAKAHAEQARAEVARCQHEAATSPVEDLGLTVRDAGTIMGISYQRVSQLVHGT